MLALRSNRSVTAPLGHRLARRAVFDRLTGLHGVHLEVIYEAGRMTFGCEDAERRARVHVTDSAAYARIAAEGTLGAAESYMDGQWACDDLVALIQMLAGGDDRISFVDTRAPRVTLALDLAKHVLRRNSTRGSDKNIRAHYDLGNAFFELFLDPTMMYSAGMFESEATTMEQASIAKLDRICQKLRLAPGERLVEIGTGWGGFALHAAQHYGVHVTTTTISREQHVYATERVRSAGLSDRVSVLLTDYRELTGTFDALVSIEMIEAVGDAYLETYFESCGRLLHPKGRALIQAITCPDARYDAALTDVDFIQKHIFPGSQIPSIARMASAWAASSDFRLTHLEDLTADYVTTLTHWRMRFLERLPEVRALGYDERFIRMWEFYLAYCEGGFAERRIGDVQLLLARSGYRGTWR